MHRSTDVPSVRLHILAPPPELTRLQAGLRHAQEQRDGALAARDDRAVRHPDGHRRVLLRGLLVCALDVRSDRWFTKRWADVSCVVLCSLSRNEAGQVMVFVLTVWCV